MTALTVHKLLERRHIYQPGCISLPEEAMNETMTQLYRRGLTVVSTRRGYGLYFTNGRHAAISGITGRQRPLRRPAFCRPRGKRPAQPTPRILLAENQTLYLGSGRRCGYGMLAFLGKPLLRSPMRIFRMLL